VVPLSSGWQGFIMSRDKVDLPAMHYRTWIPGEHYHRYELAGDKPPGDWGEWCRDHFGESGEWVEFRDNARGLYRGARIIDGRIQACAFVAADAMLPARDWLVSLFSQQNIDSADRASLLSGRPPVGGQDHGKTVCACFNVGMNTITQAIRDDHLVSIEEIGAALKAGTNCGSCIPELKILIEEALPAHDEAEKASA
jgi:assimilatory nitrate reductase catalytic subunit